MIIGVSGLVVALVAGGTALYLGLTYSIERTLDAQAHAVTDQVAALIDQNTLPDPLPVSGAEVIQVLDSRHRVLAGSVNADRLTPLLRPDELALAVDGRSLTVPGARAALAGPLRVVARTAGPANDRRTVIAAIQIADIDRSSDLLRDALLIVFPILLVVLALIAWRVIGTALAPVDAMRQAADRISGSGRPADEHLPVPAAHDEIRALAVTLNDMLRRLRQARDQQKGFVADAAHELRSPVASLRLQLEVAQHVASKSADPPDPQLVADLLTDVDRLSTIVEDLLFLARSDAGQHPPNRIQPVQVRDLLTEIAERTRRTTPEPAVIVRAGPPVLIHTDRDKLSRCIANIVDNGVRHATHHVELDVDDLTPGPPLSRPAVLIVITDDGRGIPADDRDRALHRFTRLDEARDRGAGGAGLGLAIVKELAGQLGGTITLTDPPAGARLVDPDAIDHPGLRVELLLPAFPG